MPKLRKFGFHPNTLTETFGNSAIEIRPCDAGALFVNGVEASVSNVVYAYDQVILAACGKRVYLVEHAIALCAISGIHSASISGLETKWDLTRPSHRIAKAEDHSPADVLGQLSGRICDVPLSINRRLLSDCDAIEFSIIDEPVRYRSQMGTEISLLPPANFEALLISCSSENHQLDVAMSPRTGILESDVRSSVAQARSVVLIGSWTEEAVMHAVGDIIADVVWLGRMAADIRVNLGMFYHEATIEAVRRALASEL